jgi:hypothetical protein
MLAVDGELGAVASGCRGDPVQVDGGEPGLVGADRRGRDRRAGPLEDPRECGVVRVVGSELLGYVEGVEAAVVVSRGGRRR